MDLRNYSRSIEQDVKSTEILCITDCTGFLDSKSSLCSRLKRHLILYQIFGRPTSWERYILTSNLVTIRLLACRHCKFIPAIVYRCQIVCHCCVRLGKFQGDHYSCAWQAAEAKLTQFVSGMVVPQSLIRSRAACRWTKPWPR